MYQRRLDLKLEGEPEHPQQQPQRELVDLSEFEGLESPWGEVDLIRLNDLAQYPIESAAYLIARDIEIAVVVGLLSVKMVGASRAISPSTVYKAPE